MSKYFGRIIVGLLIGVVFMMGFVTNLLMFALPEIINDENISNTEKSILLILISIMFGVMMWLSYYIWVELHTKDELKV